MQIYGGIFLFNLIECKGDNILINKTPRVWSIYSSFFHRDRGRGEREGSSNSEESTRKYFPCGNLLEHLPQGEVFMMHLRTTIT